MKISKAVEIFMLHLLATFRVPVAQYNRATAVAHKHEYSGHVVLSQRRICRNIVFIPYRPT